MIKWPVSSCQLPFTPLHSAQPLSMPTRQNPRSQSEVFLPPTVRRRAEMPSIWRSMKDCVTSEKTAYVAA
jgi:hypothetical protein